MLTFGSIIPTTSASFYHGFIYRIECNGKYYIGKKTFNQGSSWKTYKSSSDDMKELLKLYEGRFQVLEYAETKRELTYLEVKYQFIYNCLEHPECVNKNINGKFWRGKIK